MPGSSASTFAAIFRDLTARSVGETQAGPSGSRIYPLCRRLQGLCTNLLDAESVRDGDVAIASPRRAHSTLSMRVRLSAPL